MACIPYEAVYGSYLGIMFSSRTRFLIKQLVRNTKFLKNIDACIVPSNV